MLCHLFLYLYCIAETDFHIFVRGGGGGVVDKYLGGAAACFEPGGNVQKGQGKCLTKLVF